MKDKIKNRSSLSIQSFGVLFILQKNELTVLHISSNTNEVINKPPDFFIGKLLLNFLDNSSAEIFKQNVQILDDEDINPFEISFKIDGANHHMICRLHSWGNWIFMETEPKTFTNEAYISTFYKYVKHASTTLQYKTTLNEVYFNSVELICELTGFKHVLFILLDDNLKGRVVSECTEDGKHILLNECFTEFNYLHIHQCGNRRQFINYIPNVGSVSTDLYPGLQLSSAQIQSLPPDLILAPHSHLLTFLKNFNINAYFGIDLYVEGKLYGRISCYHDEPKSLDPAIREAASFLGDQIAGIIALKSIEQFNYQKATSRELNARITQAMSIEDFYLNGLRKEHNSILQLTGADGVAWNLEDDIETFGVTPSSNQIDKIANWAFNSLNEKNSLTYHTNSLLNEDRKFESIKKEASGILFFPINLKERKFIIWFKPEKITVENTFGGKQAGKRKTDKLFADTELLIKRSINGVSEPWDLECINNARKLKNDILNCISQNAEKLKSINKNIEKLVKERTHMLEREIKMRKKAENTIQQSLIALQKSNKELESFAYLASHDLQEPLRKIQAFGDRLIYLINTSRDDKSKDYLRRMMGSANRMQKLIDDLLSYSRLTTQAQPFKKINLNRILQNVISDLQLSIHEKEAKIKLDEFKPIKGDETQLHRLFLNLIQNAIKFNKSGTPPQITVKNTSDKAHCRIEVIDNGIGFDTRHSEKIFNLFERLHSRREYAGTGLGLSICKKIVDRHNGHIFSKSVKNKGTRFTIELPYSI